MGYVRRAHRQRHPPRQRSDRRTRTREHRQPILLDRRGVLPRCQARLQPEVKGDSLASTTPPRAACCLPLTQLVVGVREAGEGTTAVGFTLRVTRLPRVSPTTPWPSRAVAPCEGVDELSCRQYFTVPVSGYDILELRLERTGDNLTVAGSGGTISNGGRGLVGDLYVSTDEMFSLPPPLTYDQRRQVFNVTPSVEVGVLCTLSQQAGTYTVAVVAGTRRAMVDSVRELLTSAAEIAIDAGVARQGRGRFALHVRHARFQDGAMAAHESRPGCVGFGQTRNYTVTTSGMGDANLFTKISGANVSALRSAAAAATGSLQLRRSRRSPRAHAPCATAPPGRCR